MPQDKIKECEKEYEEVLNFILIILMFITVPHIDGHESKIINLHKNLHTNFKEYWDSYRVIPGKIHSFSNEDITWSFSTKYVVYWGTFKIDQDTLLPKEGLKKDEVYFLIYCEEHQVAYQINKIRKINN